LLERACFFCGFPQVVQTGIGGRFSCRRRPQVHIRRGCARWPCASVCRRERDLRIRREFFDQAAPIGDVQNEHFFEPCEEALRQTRVVAPGRLHGDEFALLANTKLAFNNVFLNLIQVLCFGPADPR
jgi:hypothetical protein